MAGASKSPFDLNNSTPSTLDDWSHSPTQPLDLRYGAGQLDVHASYEILAGGEHHANATADLPSTGWDYSSITSGGEHDYYFTIPSNSTAIPFSTVVAWNRAISFTAGVGGHPATFSPSLPDISLALYNANGFTKGSLVDQSISTVDNVQHIYEPGLPAGHYVLAVTSDMASNFAIGWDSQVLLNGDANRDGAITGGDYTIWADHFGATVTPFTNGDFNGDGHVTGTDYTIWADNFNPAHSASLPSLVSIPEPSSLVIAASALLTLGLLRCVWRKQV